MIAPEPPGERTGSDRKFLRPSGDELILDLAEYQISQPERVLGILLSMVRRVPASP